MLCSSVWHSNFSSVGQRPPVEDCEFISNSCLEGHSHSNQCYFILLQEWDCVKIHHRILALDGRLLWKTGWPSQEEHAQDNWPFLAWLQPDFHYMLVEIQAVINSWPLLYVKVEITDILTPNPFVAVTNSTALFVTSVDDVQDLHFKPIDSITLLLSMRKKGQQRLDQFWSSWQNDYLLSLRESLHTQRMQRCTAINITPSINDTVQIKDDTPRGVWRLGRITEVHISYDGQVRAASVKTFLWRSICHLFSLELSQNRTPPSATDSGESNVQSSIMPRPKRNAAAISELRSYDVLMDASYMATACLPHWFLIVHYFERNQSSPNK